MKILLAGLNLDIETIKELQTFIQKTSESLSGNYFSGLDPKEKERILDEIQGEARVLFEQDNLTPETLSAAYARISRNPKPVSELRQIARAEVDRARKSNKNIIFGLGHSSVAEHATFNFDIIDVSRYAVEFIEHFRLASYTEKSQRYILFKDDFIVPKEIVQTGIEKEYVTLINYQNQVYHRLYEGLRPYIFKKHQEKATDSRNKNILEGLAKEDARYVISLATQTQLGMTVNARTLENIIVKCNSHSLAEIREYSEKLFKAAKKYTPSIVKYVEPTDYMKNKHHNIHTFIKDRISSKIVKIKIPEPDVKLVDFYPLDGDDHILASILFKNSGLNFKESIQKVKELKEPEKSQFFTEIFRNMNSWDSTLREFETIYLTYEIIISASGYGQLKRHRMANIISQDYLVDLNVTVPDSVLQTDQINLFLKAIEKTNELYLKLYQISPVVAPYILTNAHRRRVLFKINVRELYHFSRLRSDQHAQWDIRQIADRMTDLAKQKFPLSTRFLCGKDQFELIYKNMYGS